MKSYLKIILSIAGLSAVSTAVFTLTSCDSTNGKSLVEAQSTPANLYRKYLSEVRGQKELSFEDLTAYIGKWRTLKDSVTAAMHRDTAYRTHFRHTRGVHSAARFRPFRTFPAGDVETSHLQRSAGFERTLLTLCRGRGIVPFRRRDPSVFRRTG